MNKTDFLRFSSIEEVYCLASTQIETSDSGNRSKEQPAKERKAKAPQIKVK